MTGGTVSSQTVDMDFELLDPRAIAQHQIPRQF